MHPQDTAIERAELIAKELTEYKRVEKAHKELDNLSRNNSVLAQALQLDNRQIEEAHHKLATYSHQHSRQIATLINAGIEE